jgi:lipopolysaccharide export LptBFGC system permease protein LptF
MSLAHNTLLRLIARRFWVVFTCVFLLVDVVAWSRHTVKHEDLAFLSTDFFYFSIAAFTTGLPLVLIVSALVLLLRMRTSGEMDMLRTFGIRRREVVVLLSHSFKAIFVLLVVAREIIIPQVRWDVVRVVHPGKPERFGAVVMKSGERDIFMKVSGDYTRVSECYMWKEHGWSETSNLRFASGRWRTVKGSPVDIPPPSLIVLTDPRSLEFLGARELLSLSRQSGLRGPYFFVLFLEHISSVLFLYLLLVIFCRGFLASGRNVLHLLLTAVAFLIAAHLTLFAVRQAAEPLEGVLLQAVASFAPALILLAVTGGARLLRRNGVAGRPAPTVGSA